MPPIGAVLSQMFPKKPTWNVDQIPDLSGKTMLVTGGNTGIGKETVKQLLSKNAKVYLAARSQSKAQEAIDDLEKQTGKKAIFIQLDLADLDSAVKAAADFLGMEQQLDVLFVNAGVMAPPMDQVTKQNFDMQFGTNVLGHYLFVKKLLPTLIATSKAKGAPSRIIWTTSSVNLYFSPPIKYDTLKDGPARLKKNPTFLYMQSKYAAVLVARQLAARHADDGVVTIAIDPGNIQSDLQRHTGKIAKVVMDCTILHPLPFGAISQLYAGTSPDGAKHNGEYIVPWARVGKPNKGTDDVKQQEEMWNYCEEQVKDY